MRYSAFIEERGVTRGPVGDFATPGEAWRWLAEERKKEEDAHPSSWDVYSDTWAHLDYIASGEHQHGNRHEDWLTNADGTGEIHGPHAAHLDETLDPCADLDPVPNCPEVTYKVVRA